MNTEERWAMNIIIRHNEYRGEMSDTHNNTSQWIQRRDEW